MKGSSSFYLTMFTMTFCVNAVLLFPLKSGDTIKENCTDFEGIVVRHHLVYVPGPAVCTSCVCHHSELKWCQAIMCSPPVQCKRFRVGERCCEFECLKDSNLNSTEIGINIIAYNSARIEEGRIFWLMALIVVFAVF